MKQFTFRLSLCRDEIMLMYQGHVRRLRVRSDQGLILELGLDKLRPFVALNGVHGDFRLKTQDDYRFIALERIK